MFSTLGGPVTPFKDKLNNEFRKPIKTTVIMIVKYITLSDASRILKAPRCGISTTARLHRWPGLTNDGTRWKIPVDWFKRQFDVTDEEILKGVLSGKKGFTHE